MPSGWYWPTGQGTGEPFCDYLRWLNTNPAFPGGFHLAQDMCNPPTGTAVVGYPVYSIGDGDVVLSNPSVPGYGPNGTAGGAIVVRHRAADGTWFTALYGHLDSLHAVGAVMAGQPIGISNAWNPPHVHFGIHLGFDIAAPEPYRGYTYDSNCAVTPASCERWGFTDPMPFLLAHPTSAIPAVSGDWNGDGIDGVWTFGGGQWTVPASDVGGTQVQFTMGLPGDLPVVGDWNNDGRDDPGIFRASQTPSTFYLDINHDAGADWVIPLAGPFPQDIPVAGDWDGDGDADVGAWDSNTRIFYLFRITSPSTLAVHVRIPVHREHSFRFNVNTDSADGERRFRSS
jgi:Peptidase family M23